MGSDLIGLLVLLRMIGFVMLITIVIVSNVFVGFGDFITYLLTGMLFFVVGIEFSRSTLKSDSTTGIFGPFVGLLGFAYIIGSFIDANGLASALGNGFTPAGRIFYLTSLVIALIIRYVSKVYLEKHPKNREDIKNDNS